MGVVVKSAKAFNPSVLRFVLWFGFSFMLLCFVPAERGKSGWIPIGVNYRNWGLRYPQEQILFPIHITASVLIAGGILWVHKKFRASTKPSSDTFR